MHIGVDKHPPTRMFVCIYNVIVITPRIIKFVFYFYVNLAHKSYQQMPSLSAEVETVLLMLL